MYQIIYKQYIAIAITILISSVLFFFATSCSEGDKTFTPLSDLAVLNVAYNGTSLSVNEGVFTITLPSGTTNLVLPLRFKVSAKAKLYEGEATSPLTLTGDSISLTLDFSSSSPKSYRVISESGKTSTYTIKVEVRKASSKDITMFQLLATDNTLLKADVSGTIVGTTITVRVPYLTPIGDFVPTITSNGASVSPLSKVSQTFNNPVSYTVTAEDGTKQTYVVTVTNLPQEIYKVAFNSNGGSAVDTQKIGDRDKAHIPDTPKREGYGFDGWYASPSFGVAFDFDKTPIVQDTTLYAKWLLLHKVNFNIDNTTTFITEDIREGDTAHTPLVPPVRENYSFEGWYGTSSFDVPFDFAHTPIMRDTTLYAKWIAVYKVNFNIDNSTTFTTENIKEGNTAYIPNAPFREDYSFEGWYGTPAFDVPFDFGRTPIIRDTTLYAKWIALHKVNFNIGNTTVLTAIIKEGDTAYTPAPNLGQGDYMVERWYGTPSLETPFDFANTPIMHDTTLYAKTTSVFVYSMGNQSVTINGLTPIAKARLTELHIPATIENLPVVRIGNRAFLSYSNLTSVSISEGITAIGDSAFYSCTNLTSIALPNSLTSIGGWTFSYCRSLTSISLPSSITTLTEGVFYNCSGLTSISLPNNITTIGIRAFYNCGRLTSISLPNSLTTIKHSAFYSCGLTSISLPNNLTTIESHTFGYCGNLTSVSLPNNLTTIESSAFSSCWRLTSISLPNSITSIEGSAFSSCLSLTSISLPSSITALTYNVFGGCSGLTSISLPNSITIIENEAFDGCSGLTSISMNSDTPPTLLSTNAIPRNEGLKIYVPTDDAVTAYQVAPNWSAFANKIQKK